MHSLAGQLIDARRSGTTIAPADLAAEPRVLDEVYAIHRAVAETIGPVGAFKTARLPGEPQWVAPIFAQDVWQAPATVPSKGMATIGVELEVGFVVTGDLPDPSDDDYEIRARDAVAPLCIIEIVHGRLADPDSAPALVKLADNQVNRGLVTGSPVAGWADLDLSRVQASFTLGDETAFDGEASVPGGNAFETFCGAARLIEQHWFRLRPGQVVTTGALNGLFTARTGTAVIGRIEGLGEIRADLPA